MIKLFNLFRKREYKRYSFYNGTKGRQEQDDFLKFASENNVRIISMYILYHDYSHNHIPQSFNYIVEL